MNKDLIRLMQGDVIAYTISELPSGAIRTENKPIALGEIHGHAHVLTGDVDRYEVNNRVIFFVKTIAVLQHINIELMKNKSNWKTTKELPSADHNPHTLPAGIYEFVIQNEYNPYKKIFEKVID
jgi:hypothetical protein